MTTEPLSYQRFLQEYALAYIRARAGVVQQFEPTRSVIAGAHDTWLLIRSQVESASSPTTQ